MLRKKPKRLWHTLYQMKTIESTNLSSREHSYDNKLHSNSATLSPRLKVNEIFFSIQGESLSVGKPTIFIRTATCNLRCKYCDTRYAFWEGKVRNVSDILSEIKQYPTKYVCLTGGEPLGQQGSFLLMQKLTELGYTVSVETGGGFSVRDVPNAVIKVLDIKCPDSGETRAMVWENLDLISSGDQLKFVVSSASDFEWTVNLCQEKSLFLKCTVLISPVAGKVEPKALAEWVLNSGLPFTLQLQLHKVIWGEQRGV